MKSHEFSKIIVIIWSVLHCHSLPPQVKAWALCGVTQPPTFPVNIILG